METEVPQESVVTDRGLLCYKCKGSGVKASRSQKQSTDKPCPICSGTGYRNVESNQRVAPPGRIVQPRQKQLAGPRARGLDGRPHLQPKDGEIIQPLCGDWRIYQIYDGHKLTSDDVTTAYVAGIWVKRLKLKRFRHLDLGTGCGSVLMMLRWQFVGSCSSVGLEAQLRSFECAERGIEFNGIDDCSVIHGDLRASATHLSDSSEFGVRTFDVVTGTPPYFDMGSFVQSPAVNQKGPCRMELRGGAEEYMLSAQRHLADGGVFVMCETSRKEAAARVERCAAELRLEIVERWDFVTKLGKPPRWSVWVFRHAASEETPVQTPEAAVVTLTIRDKNDWRTAEYRSLLYDCGLPDFETATRRNKLLKPWLIAGMAAVSLVAIGMWLRGRRKSH